MKNQTIKKHSDGTLECEVAVMIIQEGADFTAYCPALKLSTYGDSPEDVKKAFEERLEIFIQEMEEKKLLHDELIRLGWNFEAGIVPRFNQPESIQVPTYLLNKSSTIFRQQFKVSA